MECIIVVYFVCLCYMSSQQKCHAVCRCCRLQGLFMFLFLLSQFSRLLCVFPRVSVRLLVCFVSFCVLAVCALSKSVVLASWKVYMQISFFLGCCKNIEIFMFFMCVHIDIGIIVSWKKWFFMQASYSWQLGCFNFNN